MAKPVYALVGPDLFLQLQGISAILRELPPDVQRLDLELCEPPVPLGPHGRLFGG